MSKKLLWTVPLIATSLAYFLLKDNNIEKYPKKEIGVIQNFSNLESIGFTPIPEERAFYHEEITVSEELIIGEDFTTSFGYDSRNSWERNTASLYRLYQNNILTPENLAELENIRDHDHSPFISDLADSMLRGYERFGNLTNAMGGLDLTLEVRSEGPDELMEVNILEGEEYIWHSLWFTRVDRGLDLSSRTTSVSDDYIAYCAILAFYDPNPYMRTTLLNMLFYYERDGHFCSEVSCYDPMIYHGSD